MVLSISAWLSDLHSAIDVIGHVLHSFLNASAIRPTRTRKSALASRLIRTWIPPLLCGGRRDVGPNHLGWIDDTLEFFFGYEAKLESGFF